MSGSYDDDDDYEEEDFEDFEGSAPGTPAAGSSKKFKKPPGTPASKNSSPLKTPSGDFEHKKEDVSGMDLEKYMSGMELKSGSGDGEDADDLAEELAAELRPLDGIRPEDAEQAQMRERLGYVNSPSPTKDPQSSLVKGSASPIISPARSSGKSKKGRSGVSWSVQSPDGGGGATEADASSEHPSTKSSKASVSSTADIDQHLLSIHRGDVTGGAGAGAAHAHISFEEQASIISAAVEASSAKHAKVDKATKSQVSGKGAKHSGKNGSKSPVDTSSDTLALANSILEKHAKQLSRSPQQAQQQGVSASRYHNGHDDGNDDDDEEEEEEDEAETSGSSYQPGGGTTAAGKSPQQVERENAAKVDALLMELFPERFAAAAPKKKAGAGGVAVRVGVGGAPPKAKKAAAAASGGAFSKNQAYGLGAMRVADHADAAYHALVGSSSDAGLAHGRSRDDDPDGGGRSGGGVALLGGLEQQMKLLKKELRSKDDKIRRVTEHAMMMGAHMDKLKGEVALLTSKLHEAHLQLEAKESRLQEALKHKKKVVVRKVPAPAEENPDFAALLADNKRLREREQALVDAIEDMSVQNEDLIEKLKESMERELELSSKRAAATHHNVSNLQEHHHLPVISKAGVLRAQSEPLDAHSQGGGAGAGSHPQKRGGAKKKAKARA